MTTWKDRLREADEVSTRELTPQDAQRLRRTVLAAAAAATRRQYRWSLPFALTAGSLVAASVALVLTTVMASSGAHAGAPGDHAAAIDQPGGPAEAGPRQLHFATPGGTRIIWVFDADFEVKGTLP